MAHSRMRRLGTAAIIAAAGVFALGALASPAWAGEDSSHTHTRDEGGHTHTHTRGGVDFAVSINGGPVISTSDTTPLISGRVSPADGLASLALDVTVRGGGGGKVACTGMSIRADGTWSCTVTKPREPGKYTLDVRAKATYDDGASARTKAKLKLRITGAAPEPTEEPKPSPSPEPTETHEPKPSSDPSPKPKPRTSAPTASDPKPAVASDADAKLKPLKWSFRVLSETGEDITGEPIHLGENVQIVAEGLPAGAGVSLEIHSTPTSVGSATAGSDGQLTLAITVPEVIEIGRHTLVATLTAPGYAASMATLAVHVAEPLELSGELDAGAPPSAPDIEPVTPGGSDDFDSRGFDDEHTGIADSLPTIYDMQLAPWKFAATGSLAAALVLLAALPAELLQSTLTENYGRAFRWMEPARRRIATVRTRSLSRFHVNPWLGGMFTVGVAAFVLGFSQPSYGFNAESLKTFVALFLSLFMLNIVVNAVRLGVAWKKLRLPGYLMPMPGALVVAAISVIVSRWLHLNPALLFGLVIGVQFARIQSKRIAGKLALVAAGSVLALGLASWIAFSIVVHTTGDSTSLLVELVEETLAATALEALSVLLVALLPFQFLEGKHLHDWDQRIWAGMYLVAAAAFVFIAVPLGETWADAREPMAKWLSLLAGFTLISVAAWALFRLLPAPEHEREREHASR
jgi:hypothetical protein